MQVIKIKSYQVNKTILMPIFLLILGVLLFINPKEVTEFFSYIVGVIFIILGISKIISDNKRNNKTSSDLYYSLILILIGIIFIAFRSYFEFLIRFVIGLFILINGINILANNVNTMKTSKNTIINLLIGFLLILVGLYMMFVGNLVFSTIGLIMIIYSIYELIEYISSHIKKVN